MAQEKDLRRLVNHLFLPPQLPHSADDDSHLFIVRATLKVLEKWQGIDDVEQQSIGRAIASLKSIISIHALPDDRIDQTRTLKLLRNIRRDDTIALHIKAQNAALLFTRQKNGLLIDVFELSARNADVTETQGRLIRDFPGRSISIPASAVDDADFAPALVAALAAMDAEPVPEMQPKSQKSSVAHDEIRDTTEPLIVSELLVAILGSVGSPVDTPGIRKHTRDEINWDRSLEPWRRSPMWLLIRVLLQLVFHRIAPSHSRILYKKVILFVLGSVLDQARLDEFSCDELYCMTAKLDQRMKKIMRGPDKVSDADFSIKSVMTSMQKSVQYLESTWLVNQEADTRTINFSRLEKFNGIAGSYVRLPLLDQHIDHIRTREQVNRPVTFYPDKELVVFEASQLPELSHHDPEKSNYSTARLQAFEDWMHRHLETWALGVSALEVCRSMHDLIERYHKLALQQYHGNPEAISTMLLTVFEMWVASDRAITQSDPFKMLADYDPGIETRVLQNLLLSSAGQMRRLAKVETYLSARKQRSMMSARQMFTITSANGLPSRYCRSSQKHMDLLHQVRKDGDARRNAKLVELEKLQQEHHRLDTLAKKTPCEMVERVIDDWNGVQETETYHYPYCKACEYGRDRDRLTIKLFEYPLPASQIEAESIVFELCVPEVFAHWRDLRSFFLQDVLGGKITTVRNDTEYSLAQKDPHLSRDYFSGSRERRICLLSTVKPAVVTHYKSKSATSATSKNICVPNALRYQYYDTKADGFDEDPTFDDTMALKCAYVTSRPSLQRFLLRPIDHPDGEPHNETIACQESCPLDMTSEEFKSLLSLPLGRFIQWLNIGREMAMPVVDFRKADTACFFLQCIYQSGPASESPLRQSHEILLEPGIAEMLLSRLREALQRVCQNWDRIHALATFVAIAGRIATLVPTAKPEAFAFLAKAREVAAEWTRTLVNKSHEANDDADRLELTSRSFESALVCLATFDVDDDDVTVILASANHPAVFVEMSIIVEECGNSRNRNDSLVDVYFLRIHRLLHRSYEALAANTVGLSEGIRRAWAGFPANPMIWTQLTNGCGEWMTTQVTSSQAVVHYNLMTGLLLVNGEPLNEPPISYRDQPLFKTLFGIHRVEVMPSSEPGFQYSTKRRFGGFEILLGMDPDDGLLVRVINGEGVKWDVIRKSTIDGVYPRHFVYDFVHWCHLETGNIHLASTASRWPTDLDHCWSMTRSNEDRGWMMRRGDESLIHLKAAVALAFKAMLSPLAVESIIHTTVNHCTGDLNIELPLSALKFHAKANDRRLYSSDYQNMYVAGNQQLGCLIGLKNKLILESDLGSKIALIPEASLSYSRAGAHISIIVDVGGLSRVHAFEIDSLLHRLVGKNEIGCQLYLAYLHALTSFCLPDPFLKCSGTERALEILRSKSMLSHDALRTPHVNMLTLIADLSPSRQFYPKHLQSMQRTHWNSSLNATTQTDDFVTVAEAIIQHFERQKALPMSQLDFQSPQIGRSSTRALRDRAINRYSYLRVSLHGAENFTTTSDRVYKARDSGWSIRASNSYQMAVMLSRGGTSSVWPALPRGALLDVFLRIAPEVSGAATAIGTEEIQYSAACLTPEEFKHILAEFPAFQLWLVNSSNFVQRKYALRIWLASLAFAKDADLKTLQVLALMSQNIFQNNQLDTPEQSGYHLEAGKILIDWKLANILNRRKRGLNSCPEAKLPRKSSETKAQYDDRKNRAWQAASNEAIGAFSRAVRVQWPCRYPMLPSDPGPYLDRISAMREITADFERWFDNKQFSEYLEVIEDQVRPIPSQDIEEIEFPKILIATGAPECGYISAADILLNDPPILPDHPPALSTETMCSRSELMRPSRLETVVQRLSERNTSQYEQNWISDLEQSLQAFKRQKGAWVLDEEQVQAAVDHHLKQQQDHVHEIEQRLQQSMTVNEALYAIGCRYRWPRVRPIFFLQQLRTHQWSSISRMWQRAIVHYALALCNLQRAQRMKRFCHSPEDLISELQNVGHEAWDPLEHPEWLILEVESGLTIRSVQHEIAEEMTHPSSECNSVMQLNMGEGKSTVIVPMIVLALADGSRLMRVIVNRPQSKQMLQMLISKFGGIIDRQIYQLPFARSSRLDNVSASAVKAILQECMKSCGILLMQPEHILSLQHMAPEYYILDESSLGQQLLEIQTFLDENARDVIDESDENFSVNLELIYTMGQQQSIEASPDRWRIPQHVLGIIREIVPPIAQDRPQDFEIISGKPGGFPRLRLLTNQASILLIERVVDYISNTGTASLQLSKQPMSIREAFKRYISVPNLAEEEAAAIESSSIWTETTQPLILILRGLFAKGLMAFALGQKRWRVNYGLADRQPPSRLAVPYRAKDCPALRSEFSHPDVVITLTCLCYYYQGLSETDLFEALAHLKDSDQADINYSIWIADAPSVESSFKSLQGVNLKDRPQCIEKLFPSLRFSKAAIDYFLSELVFPKEIREFPNKLSASGWDIGKSKRQTTTGFSGTNDSRSTLPLDVSFLDLPKQKHTNALVLEHILQPENSVRSLRPPAPGVADAENILQQVFVLDPPVQVILDAGAQVLEDNLAFARSWLERSQDKEAAVFVDQADNVSVVDRKGKVDSLHASPFISSLSSCLVFLDQAHTRGIDLKLPRSYRAAVTLGPRLIKDNLVQACMRMRKLGHGQSVVFLIPQDVDIKIKEQVSPRQELTTADVIGWAISETFIANRRSMPLWKVQGQRYIRQRRVWEAGLQEMSAAKLLEKESQKLELRYRPHYVDEDAIDAYREIEGDPDSAKLDERCREFGQIDLDLSALQEEQERELAPEIEQEVERQRPPPMKASAHELHPEVISFAKTGILSPNAKAYVNAFMSLADTSPAQHFSLAQLGVSSIKATRDFMRTVEAPRGGTFVSDLFLRSVHWLLVATTADRSEVSAMIIISPYEANKLRSDMKDYPTRLCVYAPRCNQLYRPMDSLDFERVPTDAPSPLVPLQLAATLNVLAGQLYFSTYEHYKAFGATFGLSTQLVNTSMEQAGYRVDAHGYILSDETGRRGGESGPEQSPMRFLKDFTLIRNGGRAFVRTHLGDVLDGRTFFQEDFL